MAELARQSTPVGQPAPDARAHRRPSILPELPYPGIRPFRKEEWPIFCGRQRIVDELLHALGAARFLPVLGTSGCGKSSLIKAGLISTLERESGQLGAHWRTVEMRPANTPMWALSEALWDATHPGPTDSKGAPPEEIARLRAVLGQGPGGIARVVETYGFPTDHNLLLHVDQFEELFRFARLGNESEVERFVDQLIDVFDGQPRGIYVVSTMRTDFLGDCAHFPRLADAFNQTGYLLRRMTEAELREAIQRPARLYRGEVEQALVDRLIRDGGSEQDLLPVTEHALMWMWIRANMETGATLKLADYLSDDVGGIEGALSRHADKIFDGLGSVTFESGGPPHDLRPVTKHVFQALSETDRDGRVIRRPVPFGDLCATVNASQQDVRHIIDAFRAPSCSFLMPPHGKALEEKTIIDVSHEALLRQWSKMKGRAEDTDWINEEREDGETWKSLARAARKFKKNGKPLPSDQSLEYQSWWRNRNPTAAWSRRYTAGENLFGDASRLLKRSEVRRKTKFALSFALIIVAVLSAFYGVHYITALRSSAEIAALQATRATAEADKARAEADKAAAEIEKAAAKKAEVTAKAAERTTKSLNATAAWQTTDALLLAREALKEDANVGAEAAAYAALARHRALASYPNVFATDLSPDGSYAVIAEENSMRIVNLSRLTRDSDAVESDIAQVSNAADSIGNIAIGPRGRQVAVNYYDSVKKEDVVAIWDTVDEKQLFNLAIHGPAKNLWFSSDGGWVAISDDEGVKIVELSTRRVVRQWSQTDLTISSLVFSRDGRYVVAASELGKAMLADLRSPETPERAVAANDAAGFAAFQPNKQRLAIAIDRSAEGDSSERSEIRLVDIESGGQGEVLEGPAGPSSIAFSPDGKWLAEGSYYGALEVRDMSSGQIAITRQLGGAVLWLAFSPDSDRMLAASDDGWAHLIELPSGLQVAMLPATGVVMASFADAGKKIFTLGSDVRIWQTQPEIGEQIPDDNIGNILLHGPLKNCQASGTSGAPKSSDRIAYQRTLTFGPTILAIGGDARPIVLRYAAKTVIGGSGDQLASLNLGDINPALCFPITAGINPNGDWRLAIADGFGHLKSFSITEPETAELSKWDFEKDTQRAISTIFGTDAEGRVLAVRGDESAYLSDSAGWAKGGIVSSFDGSMDRPVLLAIDAVQNHALKYVSGKEASKLQLSTNLQLSTPKLQISTLTAPGNSLFDLTLPDSNDPPSKGTFSNNGHLVAVVHQSGIVSIWDERNILMARFGESSQQLQIPRFASDDESIWVVSADGRVYSWPLFSNREMLRQAIDAALPTGLTDEDVRLILRSYESDSPSAIPN